MGGAGTCMHLLLKSNPFNIIKLEYILVYKNSLDKLDIGHFWLKVRGGFRILSLVSSLLLVNVTMFFLKKVLVSSS